MTTAVMPAAFDGRILVVAPHMDDESLGCGLLLATHPNKEVVRVVFVTDGSHSPEQAGRTNSRRNELAGIREREAQRALEVLGIPLGNAEFLGFEDGTLDRRGTALRTAIVDCIRRGAPQYVFVPFRYDRHPDHLAINRAACDAYDSGEIDAPVIEYFVYSQWRMLPAGDVRAYLPSGTLRRVGPGPESAARLKRRALECHRSQTTRFFGWQSRPILSPELLERVCVEPEAFLLYDPALSGRRVFTRAGAWIAMAHRVEPALKRWKDRLAGWRGA